MPNIIIKEYDKTKAGIAAYENFSIVVPGFCGNPIFDTKPTTTSGLYKKDDCIYYYDKDNNIDILIFDENGIYECSSQSDFEKYIGKRKQDIISVGKYAEIVLLESGDPQTVTTPEDFYYTYRNQVYTWEPISTKAPSYYKLVVKNTAGYFKLTKAETFDSAVSYVICLTGNEGHEPINYNQNGNQITYELLGMGYTVLFKKLAGSTAELESPNFWEPLKDKSTYDFRYICTGGCCESVEAYNNIINVATHVNGNINSGRGDCIALLDIDETSLTAKTQSEFVSKLKDLVSSCGDANKYSAIFAPKVIYSGDPNNVKDYKNLTFPASFHYLACAALARENAYAEWFAVAGYTRGISNKTIASTSIKLGEVAIAAAQPRKLLGTDKTKKSVNLVITERNGFFMWGNRTAHALDATDLRASHFLNIRQLCCTLKKDIYVACRRFTFDPNSDILWVNFCETIKPTLEAMKANQGIQDYKIIKVKNTQKAVLTAKIRIVPIEAVEDFDISIFLEDSITGVNVTASETEQEQ